MTVMEKKNKLINGLDFQYKTIMPHELESLMNRAIYNVSEVIRIESECIENHIRECKGDPDNGFTIVRFNNTGSLYKFISQ